MFETPSTRGINVLKKITSDLTVTGSVSNIFFCQILYQEWMSWATKEI